MQLVAINRSLGMRLEFPHGILLRQQKMIIMVVIRFT